MDEIFYYMIGGFIILALFVILIIILIFKRKKSNLYKNIPSEDFRALNYDESILKKRAEIASLSNNKKEVNNNAKEIRNNQPSQDSSTEADGGPNTSIPTENNRIGERIDVERGNGNVKERSIISQGDINSVEQNSLSGRRPRRGKPSWR